MSAAGKVIPFNPLERKHLGASVADALLAAPALALSSLPSFVGAGIYAIYYVGDFPSYLPLAQANRDGNFLVPIYVGKAVPKGARIGGGTGTAGRDLHGRLRQHATSVSKAKNLAARDFFCRYLVVEDIWIPLGESLLVAKFAPLWNSIITGFGNHAPGSGRKLGKLSLWDQLHPGRSATSGGQQTITPEQLAGQAQDYLRSITIPTSQAVEVKPALLVPPAADYSGADDEAT